MPSRASPHSRPLVLSRARRGDPPSPRDRRRRPGAPGGAGRRGRQNPAAPLAGARLLERQRGRQRLVSRRPPPCARPPLACRWQAPVTDAALAAARLASRLAHPRAAGGQRGERRRSPRSSHAAIGHHGLPPRAGGRGAARGARRPRAPARRRGDRARADRADRPAWTRGSRAPARGLRRRVLRQRSQCQRDDLSSGPARRAGRRDRGGLEDVRLHAGDARLSHAGHRGESRRAARTNA